jgi:hypothetical protein
VLIYSWCSSFGPHEWSKRLRVWVALFLICSSLAKLGVAALRQRHFRVAKFLRSLGVSLNLVFDPWHCLRLLILKRDPPARPEEAAKNHRASGN